MKKKRCPQCQETKALTLFNKDRNTTSGLACYCRDCTKIRLREDYLQHRKKRSAHVAEYRRTHPEVYRQTAKRYYRKNRDDILSRLRQDRSLHPQKHKATARRYRQRHRDQCLARSTLYALEHWEQIEIRDKLKRQASPVHYRQKAEAYRQRHAKAINERTRQWRQRNPAKRAMYHAKRRAKFSIVAEPISRQRVYVRDEKCCYLCGKKIRWELFHLDHVIPLSRGGSHTYDNVRATHAACNLRKSGKLLGAK